MDRRSSDKKILFEGNLTKCKEDLAEIIGILLGDGGIYLDKYRKYHVTVAFNKLEKQYLSYVKTLLETYFRPYVFTVSELKTEFLLRNVSVHLAEHLLDYGLRAGDKVKTRVIIPEWICAQESLLIRCVRGLFDTDGCVYKKYSDYAQIQFKFASYPLILSLHQALISLNFRPTKIRSEWNRGFQHWKFYLSRQNEVHSFFQIIQPKNAKHISRYCSIRARSKTFSRFLAKDF